MELSFVQSNIPWDSTEKPYEAIFMISGDAAIHIERERPGRIIMQQRTGLSGSFSEVNDFAGRYNNTLNIDHEIVGFVYPKEIRIISEVEPTFAAVTTSGEVTEIKSQSKEVEVTANGTMDITPDAGFAYLNSVKVKTNVAGSGEGSASSWRYFDISKIDNSMKPMVFPFIVKIPSDNRIVPASAIGDWTNITAFGVDDSPKLYTTKTGLDSWSQMMAVEGLTPEVMAQVGFVEITEEEFYNLNA